MQYQYITHSSHTLLQGEAASSGSPPSWSTTLDRLRSVGMLDPESPTMLAPDAQAQQGATTGTAVYSTVECMHAIKHRWNHTDIKRTPFSLDVSSRTATVKAAVVVHQMALTCRCWSGAVTLQQASMGALPLPQVCKGRGLGSLWGPLHVLCCLYT